MGDHPPYGPNIGSASGRDAVKWHELRDLLTGPEQRQLADILKRLDDPVRRARELRRALPDALQLGGPENNRIARALQPVIDTAMKRSARRNPKVIADAIFPSLGPAIRKAISATLMSMVQSLNHILNQSFSFQGIKWRIEALRTRKSFAEVVLLHTLVYRVEQIYLIHRQTGIMLQHVDSQQVEHKDPDLVSGMLTAIQDFVRDSFDTDSGQIIDTLRMDGDHSIWIEHGAEAILAVVIRGTAPVDLRNRFRKLLEEVHARFGPTLENFDGQTEAFALIKPELEDALIFQVREHRQAISPALWLILAAALLAAGLLGWKAYNTHRNWQDLVAQLRDRQGIVITQAQKRGGSYHLAGLKDPHSESIDHLIAASGLPRSQLKIKWEPYLAMDSLSILARARDRLQPPESIRLELNDDVLAARGSAPHWWIRRFRKQSTTIGGISGFNDTGLRDEEMELLMATAADLEGRSIQFSRGDYTLAASQEAVLASAIEKILSIHALSQSMGVKITLRIIGHTDATGTQKFNLELSRRRARAVRSALIYHGIDSIPLEVMGAGAKLTTAAKQNTQEGKNFRAVRFKLFVESE